MELERKLVIVTGGGSGLGRAISLELAAAGARVFVGDIREEAAEQTVAAIDMAGGAATAFRIDVAQLSSVSDSLALLTEDYGLPDIVINNAGTDRTVSIEELSIDDWDRVLRTNLYGPFMLSKLCFPLMRKNGGGQIVNIVSTAAKRTWANAAAYHASKWGLLGLSHALHVEGRAFGIKVSAVISGGLKTPFILDRFPGTDPNVLQDPANVAKTVKFLLTLPDETVIPEVMVIPMRETSWP